MYYDNSFSPKLRPFMIVSAPYVDLEGNIKRFPSGDIQRALFMVARVDEDDNVLAFKITSQDSKFINEYTYIMLLPVMQLSIGEYIGGYYEGYMSTLR